MKKPGRYARNSRRTFSARYSAAIAGGTGSCPIEAGTLGRLADHECRHGRLPFDRTAACGCWPQEGAAVLTLPTRPAGHVAKSALHEPTRRQANAPTDRPACKLSVLIGLQASLSFPDTGCQS